MNRQTHLRFYLDTLIVPLALGLLIWFVYWFELRYGFDFNRWGVQPRTIQGLPGVLFSPFIHSSVEHLYSNTLPLMILSAALFYFYHPLRWKVLLYGVLFSGLLTWCIGRSSYHIGASGLIYVLFSFLFFKGIFAKNRRLIALSLVVVFCYGSMFWYLFPVEDTISWEGHLSGFITGLVMAMCFKATQLAKETYPWEQSDYDESEDVFLQHFDEHGNFISESERLKAQEQEEQETAQDKPVQIVYHYKKKDATKDSS